MGKSEKLVLVKTPKGEKTYVPQSQLKKFKRKGYKTISKSKAKKLKWKSPTKPKSTTQTTKEHIIERIRSARSKEELEKAIGTIGRRDWKKVKEEILKKEIKKYIEKKGGIWITPEGKVGTAGELGIGSVRKDVLKKRGFKKVESFEIEMEKGKIIYKIQLKQEQKLTKPEPSGHYKMGYLIQKETKPKKAIKLIEEAIKKGKEGKSEIITPKKPSELEKTFALISPELYAMTRYKLPQQKIVVTQQTMTSEEMENKRRLQEIEQEVREIGKQSMLAPVTLEEYGKTPKGLEGAKYGVTELGKGVVRGGLALLSPETYISTVAMVGGLVVSPKETGKHIVATISKNPAGFIGELIGSIIGFKTIGKGIKTVKNIGKAQRFKIVPEQLTATKLRTVKVGKNTYLSKGRILINTKEVKGIKGTIEIIHKGDTSVTRIKIPTQKVGRYRIKSKNVVIRNTELWRAYDYKGKISQKPLITEEFYRGGALNIVAEGKKIVGQPKLTQFKELTRSKIGEKFVRTSAIGITKGKKPFGYMVQQVVSDISHKRTHLPFKNIMKITKKDISKITKIGGEGVRGIGKKVTLDAELRRMGVYPNPARTPRLLRTVKKPKISYKKPLNILKKLKRIPSIPKYMLPIFGLTFRLEGTPLLKTTPFSKLRTVFERKSVEEIFEEITTPTPEKNILQELGVSTTKITEPVLTLKPPTLTPTTKPKPPPKLPKPPSKPITIKPPTPPLVKLPSRSLRLYFGKGKSPLYNIEWIKRWFAKMKEV